MDPQLDYPLSSESIVVEVGGWRGEWATKIAELYDPWILIFEPIHEYYEACLKRFENNSKVAVVHEGLGSADSKGVISKMEQASSLFLTSSMMESVEIDDAAFALPPVVDLLSLNCEGAEFRILPRLIETGRVRDVVNVQIQFHKLYMDADTHRDLIREKLALTHSESWCVPWGWESWRRR